MGLLTLFLRTLFAALLVFAAFGFMLIQMAESADSKYKAQKEEFGFEGFGPKPKSTPAPTPDVPNACKEVPEKELKILQYAQCPPDVVPYGIVGGKCAKLPGCGDEYYTKTECEDCFDVFGRLKPPEQVPQPAEE